MVYASRLPVMSAVVHERTFHRHSLGTGTHLSAFATELAHALLAPLVTHL